MDMCSEDIEPLPSIVFLFFNYLALFFNYCNYLHTK